MEKMSGVKAIKTFFESDPNGRKVEMGELKALRQNPDDYAEVRDLCAEALGVEIEKK